MKKPSTYSKAKERAWKAFSEYIRRRYADSEGYVTCVTCGTPKHWKEMQAGHWIPGRHNAVLFDERNCHSQCYHCNIGLKGNPVKYGHFMEETYGKETMAELEALDIPAKPLKVFQLLEMEENYKTVLKTMEKA